MLIAHLLVNAMFSVLKIHTSHIYL